MKKILSNSLLGIISVLLLTNCEKSNSITEETPTPQLVSSFTISDEMVNFSEETVHFNAEFNIEVDWMITIVGEESGAGKIISGYDSKVDLSNSEWHGEAASLIFQQENCVARLTILDIPDFEQNASFTITDTRAYGGSVVTDFEAIENSAQIVLGNYEFELSEHGRKSDENSIEGSWHYYLEGTDNVVENFFVGLMKLNSPTQFPGYYNTPTSDPQQLYLNCMVYQPFLHSLSGLNIAFYVDTNGDGVFTPEDDDVFGYDGGFLTHTGWEDVSFKLSDIGMGETDISRILSIDFALLSDRNLQPEPPVTVGIGIDYVAFSDGAPIDF